MPQIKLTEVMPYTPRQICDLVLDVERYPEFLPWCVACRKMDTQEDQFTAELTVSFKGFRESFRTIDRYSIGKMVEVRLLSGPFHHLENFWSFTPVEGGTRVDFSIDFRFKSRLLDMTIGHLFHAASERMVSAFRNRADELYGTGAKAGG